MSVEFKVTRDKIKALVERCVSEIDLFPTDLTTQQIASLEKICKIIDNLEDAETRNGKLNPNADIATAELENDFED